MNGELTAADKSKNVLQVAKANSDSFSPGNKVACPRLNSQAARLPSM